MKNGLGRFIIFAVVGAGSLLSLHYAKSHFESERQLILLNRTRPDFQDFLNIENQPGATFSQGSLGEYFDYFHLVTRAMPDNADGDLMLGYLELATGDTSQAGVLLNEAHRLDAQFFFIDYDLALFYYKQGDYARSTNFLQQALSMAPQATLSRMMRSIIYRQIISSVKDSGSIIAGLQEAYHDAYVLLIESKQKGLQGAQVGPQVNAHIM